MQIGSSSIRAAAAFVAVTCFIAAALAGTAQAAEGRSARTIEVTGEARVEVAADLALVDFAVVTQADTAQAAARENSARMEKLVSVLRRQVGGEDARISTGAYSIRPLYTSSPQGAAPRITGYSVSNVVHVRTKALGRLGEVIDAGVQAGANQVQRLLFTLSDDTQARRTALERAAVQARDKAQAIAAALGVRAGALYSVVEQDVGIVRPLARETMAMAAESAVTTPIEPGLIEVRGRVVLTIEVEGAR